MFTWLCGCQEKEFYNGNGPLSIPTLKREVVYEYVEWWEGDVAAVVYNNGTWSSLQKD